MISLNIMRIKNRRFFSEEDIKDHEQEGLIKEWLKSNPASFKFYNTAKDGGVKKLSRDKTLSFDKAIGDRDTTLHDLVTQEPVIHEAPTVDAIEMIKDHLFYLGFKTTKEQKWLIKKLQSYSLEKTHSHSQMSQKDLE